MPRLRPLETGERPSNVERAIMAALDANKGIIVGEPIDFWVQLSQLTAIDTRRLAAAVDRLRTQGKIWKIKACLDVDHFSHDPRYVVGIIEQRRSRIPRGDVSHLVNHQVV